MVTPATHRPGSLFAGKYRLEREIGRGGVGYVMQAHHLKLDDRVAIKFLHPETRQLQRHVDRFLREARAAAKVRNEHVTRVLDVSSDPSGGPYIVMEYLDGRTLAQLQAYRGQLPVTEAVDYVLQALEAVGEAHASGVVHRDLKTANIFVTERADGSSLVKVLDFGISKLEPSVTGDDEGSITRPAAMLGTPSYASPEQLRDAKNVDARTDVWSMGVVLYALLTNALPFTAPDIASLVNTILGDPPRSPRQLRPDLPIALDDAVMRCLQKDREQRWPSVAELAFAIAPFGPPHAHLSAERVARTLGRELPAEAEPTLPDPPFEPPRLSVPTAPIVLPAPRSRPLALALAAFGGLLLALLLVVSVGRARHVTEPAPAPSFEPFPVVSDPLAVPALPPATATGAPVASAPPSSRPRTTGFPPRLVPARPRPSASVGPTPEFGSRD